MASKTGFSGYTADQIYELDGTVVRDVKAISQHLQLRSPFSEQARELIKAFVSQAKTEGKTVAQALQNQPAQPAQQPADVIGAVTDEFSTFAAQQQVQLMKSKIANAIKGLALDKAAHNLALAQLEASNWNLSEFPELEAMVNQSEQVLSLVQEVSPVMLPFDRMVAIALGGVSILAGKIPALPATTTLALSSAEVSSGGSCGGTLPAAY